MNHNFEWDPEKARQNRRKHGTGFAQATAVFRDPSAVSVYDGEHSTREDRWATVGLSATGGLVVVHHTFEELDATTVRIRIYSARKATRREIAAYTE